MRKLLVFAGAAAAAIMPVSVAYAAIETYDISWTGSDNYSLTGVFSFNSSVGTQVRDYAVNSLSIDVFHNGVSIGAWALPAAQNSHFNFNFDAATGSFDLGGVSTGDNGQRWNFGGEISSGFVGFGSGSAAQAASNTSGASDLGLVNTYSTLKATLVSGAVPEPTTWAMFLGGFALLGAMMRRRIRLGFA